MAEDWVQEPPREKYNKRPQPSRQGYDDGRGDPPSTPIPPYDPTAGVTAPPRDPGGPES